MTTPTLFFVEELDRALSQMTQDELAQQLESFGLVREAEECRAGRMTEEEAKSTIFTCYDALRGLDRAKARRMRKLVKKNKT